MKPGTPASVAGHKQSQPAYFRYQPQTTFDLLPLIPEGTQVVTESGIHSREDVELMLAHSVHVPRWRGVYARRGPRSRTAAPLWLAARG